MFCKHNFVLLQRIAIAIAVISLGSFVSADEVIGPWTVRAPDSASVAGGTFDPDDWLNVANAPVTANEAFSGESILDDGFANSDMNLVFEVVFNTAVTNRAGVDLVMFEAQFDAGSYSISTDFDGFGASLFLGPGDFIDTGEDRDYFYGNNSSGPFTAGIWGGAIDLSDLGLSLGDTVNAIRFTAADTSTDPIGIGAIVPEPTTGTVIIIAGLGLLARRRRWG